MSLPFAIAVAPNGARRMKSDHPRLPITTAELVRDAVEAEAAGAAMIHLHVRDPETGVHLLDAGLYREAVAAIRAELGTRLVIQITTEAVGRYTAPEQIALIEALRPESVSIALKEILPEGGDEAAFAQLFSRMDAEGCLHQLILYSPDELPRIADLAGRGLLDPARISLLAVAGRYSTEGAAPGDLAPWLDAGLQRFPWMLCAFGPAEPGLMAQAAAAGGHARVGFENNLWLPDGRLAPSNAAIVEATAKFARKTGRELATAAQVRDMWFVSASTD